MPRLRRIDCTGPGIRRVKRGRGFSYEEDDGTRVSEPEVIERIAELAIPPVWTEVWICPEANGHIQATGIDDAGRKQYLYHQRWREHRDRRKFGRMLEFAARLPDMRQQLDEDLGLRGMQERRVLACVAKLLDLGFFRVGGERYAEENESYGLATMRRKHVEVKGDTVLFDFTAKDFRTWNATVLAAVAVAEEAEGEMSKTARKWVVKRAVEEVAEYLNNTPAVCRSAYIDPRVFDRFDSGETIHASLKRIKGGTDSGQFADREAIERAVRRLLG
ncbi:MAG: DNA topoisomerase IB [Solirubrobacterales bacterium]